MISSQMNGYKKLFQAAVKAYPNKITPKVQEEIRILWKEIKNNENNLNEELTKLNNKSLSLSLSPLSETGGLQRAILVSVPATVHVFLFLMWVQSCVPFFLRGVFSQADDL